MKLEMFPDQQKDSKAALPLQEKGEGNLPGAKTAHHPACFSKKKKRKPQGPFAPERRKETRSDCH